MTNVLEIINLAGSARNFIGDQLSYFQEHGDYKMHLICSPDEAMDDFVRKQNIEYYPVELKRQLSLIEDIKAFFKICRYIRKHKIDIIICHQAKARTLAIPAAWLFGVKHRIIFAHGVLHETMHGLKRILVRNNDRLLSRMATKVICVSHHVMDVRVRDGIDKPDKQVIIGNGSCNGIDTINKFNPALVDKAEVAVLRKKYGLGDDDFVIGFCGRLVRDKGVAELSDGFRLLKQRHPDKKIKLLIIGVPEKRDAVEPSVYDTLMQSPDVIFTGRVPYDDIQKYYLLMDVFILPSHRDGLGLVPLEAQAMGIPALVTSITGCKETIIENVTGNYVDLTGKSVCREIEKFFDDNRVKTFGENARQFVSSHFEHSVYVEQILSFINTLR